MLKKRLIVRLDVKAPSLVKTVNLEGLRVVGDPYEHATRYDQEGIDEIVYLDIVASLYGRNGLLGLVERTTDAVFCPVTVGGGVRSIEDARRLLRAGADKVAVNTEATKRPGLLSELARALGCQAVVLQLDAKRRGDRWEAWCNGGREPTGRDAVDWAEEAVAAGAGEILLTSVDREGTGTGFDLRLIEAVVAAVKVPVIASGGFGSPIHAVKAFEAGADGVAVARALHYGATTLAELRETVRRAGVPVRTAA